jgi:hypothetical protein
MSDVADNMAHNAQAWADESVVCDQGHRYLPSAFGCPVCEIDAEETAVY